MEADTSLAGCPILRAFCEGWVREKSPQSLLTHSLSGVSAISAIFIALRYTTTSCVLTFRIQIGKITWRIKNEFADPVPCAANLKEAIPMPEPNYADILASVEKHFPAHVLEDLD